MRWKKLKNLMRGRLKPRWTLQTKATVAVAALVCICTASSGFLISRLTLQSMRHNLEAHAAVVTESSVSLAAMNLQPGDAASLNIAAAAMSKDSRLAFLMITDARGRVLADVTGDALAWNEYERQVTPYDRHSAEMLNRTVELMRADGSMLMVRRQAVVEPAIGATPARVLGFVTVGVWEPQQIHTMRDMQDATITVTCLIDILALPLAVWWVRGWTKPLRKMVAATQRLAAGQPLATIEIEAEAATQRNDEIGLLSRSFQTMARNLASIQAALVQANQQLEGKVTLRTQELQQANDKLRHEMEEKDQFIRAISHDLGAPLRNIEGLTQVLMLKHRAEMADDVIGKLERIAANVKAENELVADLLELSRIRSQRGKRHVLDLNQKLRGIAETLSYDLEHKRIELIIDAPLPHIEAERNRFRQVFQNLIDNAIKYMPPDAAVREIHVGLHEGPDGPVFYVRDTGAGIEPRDHQTIFQLFRRAQYSGRTDVAGRGVGLATVKTIVECYGGRVWVESTPPNGTTFFFTIDPKYVAKEKGSGFGVQGSAVKQPAVAVAVAPSP